MDTTPICATRGILYWRVVVSALGCNLKNRSLINSQPCTLSLIAFLLIRVMTLLPWCEFFHTARLLNLPQTGEQNE